VRRDDELRDEHRDQDDRHDGDWTRRREGPGAKVLVLVLVAVVLLIFVLQNTDRADLDFLLWDGSFPLWTMIVAAAALGFVAGWIVGRIARAERRARRAEREVRGR
jgi:uncharacterized integral membrane protein